MRSRSPPNEAELAQAEAAAARRERREAWMQLGTTIAQEVAAIAAARQGYTDPGTVPSVPSLSDSPPSSWLPRMQQPSSIPSVSSPGSGPVGGSRSSNCEEDLTPTCRQILSTMEARMASIQARPDAGGLSMSQTYDLAGEMYKVYLDQAPACFVTETRPHCMAANAGISKEMREAYRSAVEGARQARGG